jgi:ABC-2 type transport system permease protein
VNRRHLQTFLWLRWRLAANQWRRGGWLNAWLMIIAAIGAVALAVPLLLGCFMLGVLLLPQVSPLHLMYLWDGLIAAYLVMAIFGLIDMQRTESLSLMKFLHLPVSVQGAFLINYVSSLLSLNMILFLPVMLGFCLALIVVKGPWLLLGLPLLAAFLLMVTALMYQFQGWVASLMDNPRRRRNVIMITTGSLVLLCQFPYLLNLVRPWDRGTLEDQTAGVLEELEELDRRYQARELGPQEYQRRHQEVMKAHESAAQQAQRERIDFWERTIHRANVVLPIGWLPVGIRAAAEGQVLPAVWCWLGMTSIGAFSLWRAYRTTIAIYQGRFTAGSGRAAAVAEPASARKPGRLLLEARLPGFSEPVSAVALGGFRSFSQSPEGKMTLMSPLLVTIVFAATVWKGLPTVPEAVRPLFAVLGFFVMFFGLVQVLANQFGFDRDGFRVFVLSAASRRDILLGKNLAFFPAVFAMALIQISVVQAVLPMRLDHLLALFPQLVSMYLLMCILTNVLSIYAPMPIAAGSMKPANPKLASIFLQMAVMACAFPLIQAPTLLPWGAEALLHSLEWGVGVPVYLILSMALCAAVVLVYRLALKSQGELLQTREQQILEVLTNRAP